MPIKLLYLKFYAGQALFNYEKCLASDRLPASKKQRKQYDWIYSNVKSSIQNDK